MKMISRVLMTAVAVAALAAPAMAADKLIITAPDGVTTKAVITDAGFLGLNDTTAPTAVFNAKGSTSYGSQLLLERAETNANGGAGFLAYHNNANYGMPASGDRLGYFLFGSYYKDDAGAYGPVGNLWAKNGGGIAARAEGAWSYTSAPTYFTFETAPVGATTRTERLRISSAGNIVAGNKAGAATGDMGLADTDGFLYIPSTSGLVTSCATVTQYTGHVPIWYDKTNNKLCTCNAGARKCAPTAFN